MPHVYKSKVDMWLCLTIASVCVVPSTSLLPIMQEAPIGWAITAAVVLMVCILTPLLVLFPTQYTLSDQSLDIRCGVFKWSIPLHEIRSVVPARNFIAAPALSLDRLRIDYGRGHTVLISPREQQQFLRHLASLRRRAPDKD